jgi:hypothetical protein
MIDDKYDKNYVFFALLNLMTFATKGDYLSNSKIADRRILSQENENMR